MEYKGIFAEVNGAGHFPLWMCGVLHFGTQDMYPLPELYEDAYQHAECVAFETDMDIIGSVEFSARVRQAGQCDTGTTIGDYISDDTYAELMEVASQFGYSKVQLDGYRPWYCATLLSGVALQHAGLCSCLGIDAYFHRRAKDDGKEIKALESPESQLEVLQTMDNCDPDKFIRGVIAELRANKENTARMLECWKEGRRDELQGMIDGNFNDVPEQKRRLLSERNSKWALSLEEKCRECPVLAVVGAGHLLGQESLPIIFANKI